MTVAVMILLGTAVAAPVVRLVWLAARGRLSLVTLHGWEEPAPPVQRVRAEVTVIRTTLKGGDHHDLPEMR